MYVLRPSHYFTKRAPATEERYVQPSLTVFLLHIIVTIGEWKCELYFYISTSFSLFVQRCIILHWVRSCDWLDRHLLLRLWVKLQTPRSAAWFGSENADPMLLEEETDTSPPGSVYLFLPPTTQDLTQGQWPECRFIVGVKGGGSRVLFTNPSARAGYDTRSVFKRSLTGFEFRVFLLLD